MNKFIINGRFEKEGTDVIGVDNRGFRYGDGLFETMKMVEGEVRLAAYHLDRLRSGMALLQFEPGKLFNSGQLLSGINELCRKNGCEKLARVRVSVFRGDGGLYDESASKVNYVIQSWPLDPAGNQLNENGLVVGIYREIKKSCDRFSNLKSANYLPYVMGALYARKNRLNESIILNTRDRLCDATITNLFLVKGNEIITPALTEGCVAGVMRRYLLEKLPGYGFSVSETMISEKDLPEAGEVFLTNAVSGIKWVARLEEKEFSNRVSSAIYKDLVGPLFRSL